MGSDFFWFYDVFLIAIAISGIYHGAKRGAVSVLISALAAVAAFIVAFTFTGVISDKVYDSIVRDKVEDYMEERLGSAIDTELITGLSQVDMLKTKVNGVYVSEMTPEYDERGNALLDLSVADLTETGIENADLQAFGITKEFDLTAVKIGHIDITESEVRKYGLSDIILAKLIAMNLTSGDVFTAFTDIGARLGETVSPSLKNLGADLSSGSRDAVYNFTVSIITAAGGTLGSRVMNDIVEPTVMLPLKALVFVGLFAAVMLILGIVAAIAKLVNKIPVVSSVNGTVGALLGLAEALIILVLTCVMLKLLIAFCGSSLVFINEATIERTFVFKYLYSFDPFSLFGTTINRL